MNTKYSIYTILIFLVFCVSKTYSQSNLAKTKLHSDLDSEIDWKKTIASGERKGFLTYLINHPNSNIIEEVLDSLRSFSSDLDINGLNKPISNRSDDLSLMINDSDLVLLNRKMVNSENIVKELTRQILNKSEREDLPSKYVVDFDEIKEIRIPKYSISILSLFEVPSNKYTDMIIQSKSAINNVRNYYSLEIYKVEYDELDEVFKVLIDEALPYSIDILFVDSFPNVPKQK